MGSKGRQAEVSAAGGGLVRRPRVLGSCAEPRGFSLLAGRAERHVIAEASRRTAPSWSAFFLSAFVRAGCGHEYAAEQGVVGASGTEGVTGAALVSTKLAAALAEEVSPSGGGGAGPANAGANPASAGVPRKPVGRGVSSFVTVKYRVARARPPSPGYHEPTGGGVARASSSTSVLVAGGAFYPATLSSLGSDAFEITVGRLNRFVAEYEQHMSSPRGSSDRGAQRRRVRHAVCAACESRRLLGCDFEYLDVGTLGDPPLGRRPNTGAAAASGKELDSATSFLGVADALRCSRIEDAARPPDAA